MKYPHCPHCEYKYEDRMEYGDITDKGDFFESPLALTRDDSNWDDIAHMYACPNCRKCFISER